MFWMYMSAAFFPPLMFIINISNTESFFKTSHIPISEEPNLVGQWSAVMGAGLVVVAAAINKWAHHRQTKREGETGTEEGQEAVESIHIINNGQYKCGPDNGMAQAHGIGQAVHV
jgi:hypothetical protein